MGHYRYQIFVPGGNKTALVFGIDGLEQDIAGRKLIQDHIFARHAQDVDGEVEQVGFVHTDFSAPRLIMAGGEFCGNATRAATAYYLDRRAGAIELTVSGATKPLLVGGNTAGEIWAEMPVLDRLDEAITYLPRIGSYWVSLSGISHLVVPQLQSVPYLTQIEACAQKADQLKIAFSLLKETIADNELVTGDAYGVIFLENIADMLKMHPFVHVQTAGTTYYETGCGSGAMCVGLVSSLLRDRGTRVALLQPSGKMIHAEVECRPDGTVRGKISGTVLRGAIHEAEF